MICRPTATASQAIHYEHRSVSQPEQPIDDNEGVAGGSHRSCLRLAPPRRNTRRQGQQSRWRQQILPPPGLMVMPAQLLQDEQLTTIHKQPVPMYHHRSVSTSSTKSHKSSSVASQLSTHEDPARDAAAADTVSSSASASSSQQPLLLSAENGSAAPKATRPSIASLLTLPAPQDRSSKLQYERRKRLQQHGLQYEGELEPVGRRGEEAIAGGGGATSTTMMTTTQQPSAAALPHMRDFSAPPIVATLKKGSPMPPSRVRQTRQSTAAAASLFKALPDDDSDDDEQDLLPPEPQRDTALSNPFAGSSRNSPVVSPRSTTYSNHSTTSSQSSTTSSNADHTPLQINPNTGQVVKGFRYVAQQAQQKSLLQPALTASSTQSEDDADHDAFLLSCSTRQALSEQPKQQRGHDRTTTSHHDKCSSSQDSSPTCAGAKCTRNHADSATTFASAPPSPSAVVVTSNIHSLNAQALAHVQNNEFDMALDCFSRVLVLLKDMHAQTNPNHPAIASCHHNLGTLHAKRAQAVAGEYLPDSAHQHYLRQLALSEFQAAARTARDGLGRNHPNVAVSLVRIGFLLLQSRQYQNAVTTFREALRIRVAAFGTTQHALVANLYNNLGVCHLHLGQFENGLEYLQAALDIQRHASSSSLDTGNGDANTSSASTVSSSASNQHLIKETKWVQQLELADTLFNVGGLCLEWIRRQGPDTRRAMDAEDAFAEALEIRLKVLGPEDPMVLQVKALLDMARALPRPRLRSMSPGRSPRQDFIADSSPRSSNQHYEPDVTLPPIHLSPRSSYTTNQHASASTQPSEPGSTGSRPFDESSIRSRPSPMTPRALNRTPSEPEPTRHDCIFRTPPRNSAVAVVTPASDRIATKYNERYSNGVVSQPKSPRWLIPTGSKDEDDSQIIKNSTKVYLAPHIVPESPGRTTRQNPPTSHSVIFSTGNNERDELMNRVKALLDDNESIYAADSAAHQVTPERPTKPNQYPI